MKLKLRMPSPAMGVACIALAIALSGAAYAATLPRNSVGTPQLKKNAVVSSKVRNGSLLGVDFKAGQLPAGPKGDKGDPGEPAARTLVVRYGPLVTAYAESVDGDTTPESLASCAPGERLFSGGFAMGTGISDDFAALRSQPWVADGVANPTVWGVEFENRDSNQSLDGEITGRAIALCGSP
jgi:hypothetical protein